MCVCVDKRDYHRVARCARDHKFIKTVLLVAAGLRALKADEFTHNIRLHEQRTHGSVAEGVAGKTVDGAYTAEADEEFFAGAETLQGLEQAWIFAEGCGGVEAGRDEIVEETCCFHLLHITAAVDCRDQLSHQCAFAGEKLAVVSVVKGQLA